MTDEALSCEEVIEHIFDYLDGELDQATQGRIERHLETCRDCFSRAEFEELLRRKIRAAGSQKAPERLQRRIREMLDRF